MNVVVHLGGLLTEEVETVIPADAEPAGVGSL